MENDGAPGKRVLVIDDEPGFRDMLKWYLLGQGLQVVTAENGEEALRRLSQGTYSLIISDLTMPVVNGIEFLENLKRLKPQVPIIMMTGFGTIECAVHAMKRGANDFILKPFSLNHLAAVIEGIFGDWSGGGDCAQ